MMYSQTISLVTTDNRSRSLHCVQSQWQFQIFRSLHVLPIHIFKRILFVTFIIISIAFASMFINSKKNCTQSFQWYGHPLSICLGTSFFSLGYAIYLIKARSVWNGGRDKGCWDVRTPLWNPRTGTMAQLHTKEASTVATSSSDMSAQTTSSCLDQREVISLIW
jgi:hypothetical protein